jgi:hypothetical protein
MLWSGDTEVMAEPGEESWEPYSPRITEGAALSHFRPRWQRWGMVAVLVGLVVYGAVTAKRWLLDDLVFGIACFCVVALVVAFLVGRVRRVSDGAYWEGPVCFHEDCFTSAGLFPNIVRTPRPSFGL